MQTATKKPPAGWSSFKLYNGDVTIGFDAQGRATGIRHSYWLRVPVSPEYPLGRRLIPGVTGISGLLTESASGLSPWAAWCAVKDLKENHGFIFTEDQERSAIEAHTRQRDGAAVRGTAVHKMVERILGGEVIAKDERNAAYKIGQAVVDYLHAEGIKVVGCEIRVFSRKHEYCGTMDLDVILSDGTRAAVVDIKTSKAFRLAHAMQIAAYAMAREEEYPDTRYEDAGVLLASTRPTLKLLSHAMKLPGRQALDRCYNAFLGLLAVRTSIPDIKGFGQNA